MCLSKSRVGSASCFSVSECLDDYFRSLNGHSPAELYEMILDQIEPLGTIRDTFPTHYSGDWSYMFTRDLVANSLWDGALISLGYIVVFIGFGAWWFRRKDVLS